MLEEEDETPDVTATTDNQELASHVALAQGASASTLIHGQLTSSQAPGPTYTPVRGLSAAPQTQTIAPSTTQVNLPVPSHMQRTQTTATQP